MVDRKEIDRAFYRHVNGDWGEEIDEMDKYKNNRALVDGNRMFSDYRSKNNIKFWIITEWNRNYTTILLPEEY